MPRITEPLPAAKQGRAAVGRPPVISLEDVLQTATTLAERVGVDGLTMNLVGDELGVSAAALYHYVPSKQALINLVIDRAFAAIELPPVEAGPWDVRLRLFERAVRTELRRLKWGTPQVMNGDPPESLRRLFAMEVEIIAATGADEKDVMLAVATVYAYMVGQLWFDSATSDQAEKEPTQIAVAARRAALDSDDLFDYGLEVVIDGLKQRLTPKKRRRR